MYSEWLLINSSLYSEWLHINSSLYSEWLHINNSFPCNIIPHTHPAFLQTEYMTVRKTSHHSVCYHHRVSSQKFFHIILFTHTLCMFFSLSAGETSLSYRQSSSNLMKFLLAASEFVFYYPSFSLCVEKLTV